MSSALTGVGVGLRPSHAADILSSLPTIDWLELLVDNHLCDGGFNRAILKPLAEHYPLSFHCVSMDVGGKTPLNKTYLAKLKQLAEELQPQQISDHISFCRGQGRYFHNLLPSPFNRKELSHYVDRVKQIQDILGRQILLENVSRYIDYQDNEMTEGEFMTELCQRADCFLLFDVNNAYVNQHNHHTDALEVFNQLPLARIKELHLAGYEQRQQFLLDSHSQPVSEPVWQLYREVYQSLQYQQVPTLIEWDNKLPPLTELLAERDRCLSQQAMATGRATAEVKCTA
ncbi:hypothetical protein SIN8267_02442 [Sinobacterium norvegicum]|uniref:Uncharacterized protein n=1 Tax=Sinobacterium norvegicum TaxID=1641715 RepID=A0ABM9AGQ8_9GAMM|nr:DUF692 domain-containing protein [Sinobacterium norvegicum]CAH0992323.1 hypothetical protein SIN8267_02442 [Sinobacterium norvegicum]